MKKILTVVIALVMAGSTAWFFLLRPETVSQEMLTDDFEAHRKAYQDVADYLRNNRITTEITDIPKADHEYAGIKSNDSKEYGAFMEGVYEIMKEDHDAIISDGKTVEFVYHSTGGKFTKIYGSVIYNGWTELEDKISVPLTTDGWHLYLAQE